MSPFDYLRFDLGPLPKPYAFSVDGTTPAAFMQGVIPTWKVEGSRGIVASATTGTSSVNNARNQTRTKYYFGEKASKQSQIAVVLTNYSVPVGNTEASPGFSSNVQVAIEITGAPTPTVQFTFDGIGGAGAANAGYTLADGEPFKMSSGLTPSQFGLSAFPGNGEYWIRTIRDNSVGDTKCIYQPTAGTGLPVGEASWNSATTGTNTNQLLGSGALNGTSLTSTGSSFMVTMLVGLGTEHSVSVLGIGDSIMQSQGETSINVGDGSSSGGFFRRAMYSAGRVYTLIARSSTTIATFNANSTKRSVLFPYFTHALVEYGTNDLQAGTTAATVWTSLKALYAALKTAGVGRVEQSLIVPRTGSGGDMTLPSGQTPITSFANGDTNGRKTLNDTIIAGVSAANKLDGYIDTASAVAAPTQTDVWDNVEHSTSAGTPIVNTDGTHPLPAGHILMAAPVQTRAGTWTA